MASVKRVPPRVPVQWYKVMVSVPPGVVCTFGVRSLPTVFKSSVARPLTATPPIVPLKGCGGV
jgi:hypothetical protein